MSDKFAKIKFSMNDKGKQTKTGDEHQPRPSLKYPKYGGTPEEDIQTSKRFRRQSVPGSTERSDGDQGEYSALKSNTKTDDSEDTVQGRVRMAEEKLAALKRLQMKSRGGNPYSVSE